MNGRRLGLAGIALVAWSVTRVWAGETPPLTLARAITIALKQNPRLGVSRRQVEAAQARVGQALAQSKTTLALNGRYTHQGPTVSFTVPGPGGTFITEEVIPADTHNLNLHAQRVLYSGGRLRLAPRAAEHAVGAAAYDLETARRAVVLKVKQAYFGLLKAQRFREVARQAVAQAQEHLRLANAQFAAGAVARFDVIRSEVALADTQQQLVEADSAVQVAEAAFNNALGRPLETPVNIAPAARWPRFTVELDTCLAQAATNRPELKSLAANIKAAETRLALVRAGKRPTLALSADYNKKVATAFGEDYDWNTTLTLQLPLLDGKLTRAETQEAAAALAQLRESREQLLQGISLQVKSAYLTANQASRRIGTATKAIEQAQEAYRIAKVRYTNGMGTNVEVTDAELALTRARTNETRAIYDYYLALADLEHATGLNYADLVARQRGKRK